VPPLHWEVEFPEVFGRRNAGFDAIVGNPPFLTGKRISTNYGDGYRDWLSQLHIDSNANADLVAHFYRRAFSLVRERGTFGLIATNTIRQGDTRSTGLRWICTYGGEIYGATRRVRWPGLAAVVVCVVHVFRGEWAGSRRLDGREVPLITAFLFDRGGHDDPHALRENDSKSFIGSYVLGMGFTFDDTDKKRVASPIAEMHRLVGKDPRNAERIFPYIGGEEVNTSPSHEHHRYVINFGEMTQEEARRWPELMAIVETKVKPERLGKPGSYSAQWWLFGRRNQAGSRAIVGLDRVLVTCRHQHYWSVASLGSKAVFAESLVIFPLATRAAFCALQSSPHEIWARFFGSSMKDDPRYAPSDCFETFPFSPDWQTHPMLEAAGQAYYDFRAALMIRNYEGLTETYNRFHDPSERDSNILRLRELHADMDLAVLDAYGWTDIPTECGFFLDYEIDEETWGEKKKPYRYRWPDAVHDEVLTRLLVLNRRRYEEEVAAGLHGKQDAASPGTPENLTVKASRKSPKAKAKSKARRPNGTLGLFDPKEEDES
jgi:hypothetical protein